MEKVVYILGAGFSAPLNIPVMSNFLEKSKDMFFQDQDKFAYFKDVFETIRKMSYTKNYYKSDLLNIEEILSIFQMQERFGNIKVKKSFVDFISDVIEFYTPSISSIPDTLGNDYLRSLFSTDRERLYGYFIASLFGIGITTQTNNDYERHKNELIIYSPKNCEYQYSIITLNYDLVIENFVERLNKTNKSDIYLNISRPNRINDQTINGKSIQLSKLHGSIDIKNIVPPTWNKSLENKIEREWKLAFKLLKDANHIRFLGYSLPLTDTYVNFLLKSSVIYSEHLKSIDVLCLDDNKNTVRDRYDTFIQTRNYRFVNGKIEGYLQFNFEGIKKKYLPYPVPKLDLNQLEAAHNNFFSNYFNG